MTIIYVRIKFLVRLILQCFSFVRSGGKREENIPVFFEIVTSVIAHVSVEVVEIVLLISRPLRLYFYIL